MKKCLALILILVCLLFAGCKPTHLVINNNMVVYQAEERKNQKLGKYEYCVRDNTTKGWMLITDEVYNVGDTLVIKKLEK